MTEPTTLEPAAPKPRDGSPRARVLVAGASGYVGALAARLVWRHPRLELAAVTSRGDAGRGHDELYPGHGVPMTLEALALDALDGVDAALVSYPHGAAAPLVAGLRAREILVVDLSADFRLRELATYERWYGQHGAAGILDEAAYGLTELRRSEVAAASLVANPGCYPTAALLALAPLVEAGLCGDVVVDAKSGFSGAGRGGVDAADVSDNLHAYAIEGHRHAPELRQELAALGGAGAVTFVPHLLSVFQGLLASCYVTPTREIAAGELRDLYEARYAAEEFVHVVARPPALREVRETNDARVHVALDPGSSRILASCAIDNLWKGAAGQAIQNLNVMLGLPEAEGLR